MSGVLRHRGLEAWLEDSNDSPIALSEDANIDLNTISTWVNVTPSQYYTLRWRAIAGCDPCSALCNVYVADGFHYVDSKLFCVSTIMMDSTKRITQSKTTKGWLNPPYNRLGCLRVCRTRRMLADDDESTKKRKTQPGILLLGSVRLEIRRVSGCIRKDQVYWGEGPDGIGVCVFNPDGITVDDDAARGDPPWIVFEFKFRKVTQHITEENVDTKIGIRSHLKTSRKSSSARPSDSDCDSDQLDNSDDDSNNNECHISKTKAKEGPPKPDSSGANITQGKRPHDVKISMETVNRTKLHTSSSDSVPNKLDTSRPRPSQQDKVSSYPASSPLALPAIGRAEGISDVTSLTGPSTHTSLRPHIPRDGIVSNVKLVAPDSGLNLYVAVSQRKVAHPPSPPPTKDVAAAAAAAAFLSDSHNSPVPTTCETDPEMASRIESSEGDDRAVTPPTRSELANKDNQIFRKGKRKIFDGGDTDSCVPTGDGGFKRRKTMVAEDDSDIEYIGSWTPGKIQTKNIIQTAVKKEILSDGPLPTAVKREMAEIRFEDNNHRILIDQMMGDYDTLKRKKEELKQKLAERIEAQQREIEDLLHRLSD